jgi:hypothetical protein
MIPPNQVSSTEVAQVLVEMDLISLTMEVPVSLALCHFHLVTAVGVLQVDHLKSKQSSLT